MRYRQCILFGIPLLFAIWLFAEENTVARQPDPQEIIRRVAVDYQRDINKSREYTFQQRAVTQEFDKNCNLKETRTRTYETVILFDQPYRKLVAVNDAPLSEIDLNSEEERLNNFLNRWRLASKKTVN